MKKYLVVVLLSILSVVSSWAQDTEWQSDKYSMFIHFGLYSHFGGVWGGEPVRQGYSEQIQSFAGIFSDWYGEEAAVFDPVKFDADEIARLAKDGGMRSIVFTSKHHDGFCMFDTKTTSYSSVAKMPSHRDFVMEMSEACARHNLRFGLYYSLIDWNYPHAYPISSHNADFVTPEHHEFSKAQVRELLTNYGPVSELWFDMGSLEPWQSRELYDLVKELQPDCMVSGRLGNDVYDFAVMADNKLPESALHAPWQSAASMFPETWSYRSWQERGSVDDKVAEKLRSLIKVVSHGGNYLLNIGPASDGSVVPFEREVLLKIGKWLLENGDAIYGTQPSPFNEEFAWGDVTINGNDLYLLLTGTYPKEGYIELKFDKIGCRIPVDRKMFADPADVHVIKTDIKGELRRDVSRTSAEETLSWKNATPDYSYSCFDYYSNYRSTVAYNWLVVGRDDIEGLHLRYAMSDAGKTVNVQVGEKEYEVTLGMENMAELDAKVEVVSSSFGRMRGGTFDRPTSLEGVQWEELDAPEVQRAASPFSNYLMKVILRAGKPCRLHLHMITGNGMELLIRDKSTGEYVSMMKHLNPYRAEAFAESVVLDLEQGDTEVVLRSYNRFEDNLLMQLKPHFQQREYTQTLMFEEPVSASRGLLVRVSNAGNESPHTDCCLHNLRLRLVK
ncbi:MAG: alpha-L-fucosidase [Bacteroidales bacterium]|nr:alpha-L-fucosidase [Bacteroidales bacterium]